MSAGEHTGRLSGLRRRRHHHSGAERTLSPPTPPRAPVVAAGESGNNSVSLRTDADGADETGRVDRRGCDALFWSVNWMPALSCSGLFIVVFIVPISLQSLVLADLSNFSQVSRSLSVAANLTLLMNVTTLHRSTLMMENPMEPEKNVA